MHRLFGKSRQFARFRQTRWVPLVVFCCSVFGTSLSVVAAPGQLELRVVDEATGEPVAVTMQLWDSRGRSRKVRGAQAVGDRFVVDGTLVLKLPPGRYTFNIERGMEYLDRQGHFLIRSAASDNHTVTMKRFVDMRALGWRSVDVAASAGRRIDALMRSLDLQYLASGAADNETWEQRYEIRDNRASDRRGVFASMANLALWQLEDPEQTATDAAPAATQLLKHRRTQANAYCQGMDVAAIDLPMWVASGALDAVTVIAPWTPDSNSLSLPRDESKYPGHRGAARWREHLYHQLLESGLRLAPTATSYIPQAGSFGDTSRTYVWLPPQVDDASPPADEIWSALATGKSMLTNGPLMIAKVNGQAPGFVFDGFAGETVELKPTLTLHTKQRISYLEILKDGEVAHQVRLDDWVQANGELPSVAFTSSGWMLVRAVIDSNDEYRLAMTAPCFVEFDSQPRISAVATSFFAEWAQSQLATAKGGDEEPFHRAAARFWESKRKQANVP